MEITRKLKIVNRLGLHLRAAAQFVKTTAAFKSRILVKNKNGHVNGKSLLNLLALAASYGTELTFVIKGDDANEARAALERLFLDKFGEKE